MSLIKKPQTRKINDFFKIKKSDRLTRLLPIILFIILVIFDQVSKALVVKYIELRGESISIIGNWINFVHVRNQGVAWSGMRSLTGFPRITILIALPILFLTVFGIWSLFTNELTKIQRWATASIMAGGIGNIIDRIFRYASGPKDFNNGVVDFIDMSFPTTPFTPTGRWPTFNIADASIVVGVVVLFISMLIVEIQMRKKQKKEKG